MKNNKQLFLAMSLIVCVLATLCVCFTGCSKVDQSKIKDEVLTITEWSHTPELRLAGNVTQLNQFIYEVTAICTPELSTWELDWTLEWQGGQESENELGQTIDYVQIGYAENDAYHQKITLTCLAPFAETMILTASWHQDDNVRASVTVDYTAKVDAIMVSTRGSSPRTIGGNLGSAPILNIEAPDIPHDNIDQCYFTVTPQYSSVYSKAPEVSSYAYEVSLANGGIQFRDLLSSSYVQQNSTPILMATDIYDNFLDTAEYYFPNGYGYGFREDAFPEWVYAVLHMPSDRVLFNVKVTINYTNAPSASGYFRLALDLSDSYSLADISIPSIAF